MNVSSLDDGEHFKRVLIFLLRTTSRYLPRSFVDAIGDVFRTMSFLGISQRKDKEEL